MSEESKEKGEIEETVFSREVSAQAARKLKAQRNPTPGVWNGLGTMGLIGWSVVIPTLIGAAIGNWLDNHHPGSHSWTLALLVAGLSIGCLTAWYWVANEDKAIREDNDE
jgi:ATP synthase protein I